VALATQHGKESVIAPVFSEILSASVLVSEIDTDQFGTFTGEIKRPHSPRETAIHKASAGMRAAGIPLGLASEGTIGPHPVSGFTTVDTELMVFIDDERDLVIAETIQSFEIVAQKIIASPQDDISQFLQNADFPRHGLIVRSDMIPPEVDQTNTLAKGIADWPTLRSAIEKYSTLSGKVLIENDFRAHFSPSRMAVIRECAGVLAERIATTCPECFTPGWGRIEPLRGLDCSGCGTRNDWAIHSDRTGCLACEFIEIAPRLVQIAEPRWCNSCNP